MRPVSERFSAAIARSHRIAVDATVLSAGASTPIDILDGTVTLDATATTLATLDLEVPMDLNPTTSTDLLVPNGNQIRIAHGIDYGGGERELVDIGTFRIESVSADANGPAATLSLNGLDRSVILAEAEFEEPRTLTAGVPLHTAIEDLVLEVMPDCETLFATTALTTPAMAIHEENNYWEVCSLLALAMGCSLFFNGSGVLVLAPAPTGASPAVTTIAEGEGGVLLGARKDRGRENTYNRAVVTGDDATGSGDVPRGIAIDSNPLSPTNYGGPFGRKTWRYADPAVLDDAQAEHVAQVILSQKLGLDESIEFSALPNPALEPLDVATIVRDAIGVNEKHIIDSLSIPLSYEGTMSGRTRVTQVSL